MGLPELMRALELEVDRQVHEIQARTRSEGERLLEECRRELDEKRRSALERERARLDEEAARARSRLRVERNRKVLTTKRELLGDLRQEVERRARTIDAGAVLPRLVDEVAADVAQEIHVDGGHDEGPTRPPPIRLRVEQDSTELLRRHLETHHPDIAGRVEIEPVGGMSPGVEVVLDRGIIDNTLPSRLCRLWPIIEGRVAEVLFGDDRDGL